MVGISVTYETMNHFLKEAGEAIYKEVLQSIRRWTNFWQPFPCQEVLVCNVAFDGGERVL